MIYRSKVDRSIAQGLLLLIVLPFAIGLTFLILSGIFPAPLGWMILLVSPAVAVLERLFVWPVTYDPEATRADGEPILLVRGGRLLRYEIPIDQITEVKPATYQTSSPALSLDRLEIKYPTPNGFRRSLLISPRDRDGFLDELARRAGNLERTGDRLTRRPETHGSHESSGVASAP
jgi:hypothetical protein